MTDCAIKVTTVEDIGNNSCSVVHKTSRAHRIWLGVVVLVLSMLWLETRNVSVTRHNFMIGGNNEAVGAEVWIDGQKVGLMTGATQQQLAGALFYTYLGNGGHEIELRKPGFKTFLGKFNMQTEGYLNADLKPEFL
ncbi:MAG: hypothetical protein HY711_06580 [Candidatus Melainabacteria bacterium]|nr:hypothetical protein [Candidatus Melainabacteria bacterium]